MSQLGRISGQLLKDNLTRNGHDLTFDNDLLHLDVTGRKIGIKNTAPTTELDVTGTTKTTDLFVTTQSTLADLTVLGSTITSNTGTLNLTNNTSDQVTVTAKLVIDDIDINTNIISTNLASGSNTNLELRPNGTGSVDVYANTNVYGNIYATGNIRADGNITVGDANTDNITINADVASDIIPNTDITYTLGNGGTGYVEGVEFTLGNVTLTVSGTGTTVVLSIPAAGPTWVNTLIAHTAGKAYQIAIDGTPGSYTINTLGAWSGTNPKTVSTTNDGLVDGVYNVASIRFDQKRWLDLWVKNVYADAIVSGDVTIDGINLNSVQGKIYYVATNGSDTNAGEHQNDPFATVKKALSVAASEDTVYIYPGTYTEIFPLTVPVGVTVRGTGIRSVKIVPTTATRYNDAFLLNGETTVEDVTIADFFSGGNYFTVTAASTGSTTVNVGTAPYAHTYVSGGTINIGGTDYTITNAVYTHTTGVVVLTHTGGTATPTTSVFVSNLTFSCNGGNRVFPDNGYTFRFATDFAVTSRSPYVRNITVLTKGSVTSLSDPLGYDEGDAGKGAYVDGAYATALSKEAAMLFHSVTFICPGVDVIVATNGARIEWLNSFTYYANRSMYLYSSNDGFAGDGKTRVKITDTTGTWAVGNTLSYYDTDGTTVLASGVIESIDGDFYNIDTRVLGFEQIQDRTGKTISVNGNAKLSTAVKKFGTASLALDGTGDYLSIATQPDFAFPAPARLAKTITVNGNAVVSATQSKFGGSSIAFDGTGDYLSLATDTDYGFGTGDFTIEGWFYKTAALSQILVDTRTTSTENSIMVQSNGGGNLRLFVNGVFVLTSSNNHTLNTWNHLAISRASGVTRFFINGVVSTNTYVDATDYGTTKPLVLGASFVGLTSFSGYIDDFRVSNTARYTTTFTPSTTAFTADSASKLLIHADSTIVDDNGGGTVTDFTLEAWIYPTVTTYHSIFDFRSVSTEAAIYLGINLSNQVYLYVNGVVPITTAAISLNVWTHVAVVRYNATTKIYINGTQSGSSWADITNYGTTKPLRIGAWYNALYGFTGYIDDVRITKGVARYTTTFAVPTAQLTGDLSTVLLITCNGLNNSTAIADNGITLQDLRTSAGGTASIIDFADYSDFGVELRSIGSAAVYGNYGIYGDGIGVIAYLIGQNLAYIGNGKATTNDPVTVIQANEVVELNDAKIYYNSVDHKGDFRIGDLFYVNQATGEVSFTNSSVSIGTSLTFDNGLGDATFIDATKIETGDFRISGNTIETLTQDFNVDSASNQINLQSNVTVTGNLEVTGDVTVGGNVTIGNESTDVVRFVAGVDSDILPKLDSTYDLGTSTERWSTLYSTTLINANIQISTNVITTTDSNLDLTLQANGTGRIYVPLNNVEITNNLTVNGVTDVQALNVTGTLTHVGDVTQTGNVTQTGDITLTGTFTTTSYGQFADIKVNNNNISTTLSNNDLVLDAAGTGRVYVPDSDVEITQDLTVTGYIDVGSLNVDTSISSLTLTAGDVKIQSNYITTLTGNNNLELRANGSGLIYVPANDVEITNNLTVLGTTNLATTNIGVIGTPSTVTHIGGVTQTGDLTQTGSTEITGTLTVGSTAQFQDIKIDTNTITTTVGTNNLILSAAGTGRIYVPTNNVTIENTLTVVGTTTTSTISNTGTVTSGTFNTSNVSITSNNITSRTGNSNLVLEAAGSGKIYVPSNSVQLDQNLTVNGTTNLKTTNIGVVGTPSTVTHVGGVTQTGDLFQTGNTEITGTLTVGSTIQFEDIEIDNNVITTTIGNNDLILEAAGTGKVSIPTNDAEVTGTLTVLGITSTTTIGNTGTITSGTFSTGDISISTNNIATTLTNSNLVLEANGNGIISIPTSDVELGQNLTVLGTTTLSVPLGTALAVVGDITHTGAVTQTGDVNQTGNLTVTGTLDVGSTAQFEDIKVDLNVITTTIGNNDLVLEAAGTGKVIVPLDNAEVTGTLTVVGTTSTTTINNTGTVTSDIFSTGNIRITTNNITTTLADTDLVLEASGTGRIYVPSNDVTLGKTLTVTGLTTLVDTGITGTLTHVGATTRTGDVNQTGNYVLTGNLTVSNIAQFKDVNITNNVITTTLTNSNLQLGAAGTGIISVPTNNVTIDNNLTVTGTTFTANINNSGTVTAGTFTTGNISINGNTIQTTVTNSNLQLQAAGTGYIVLEQFDVQENEIRINTGSDMVITPNGTGIVTVNSTQSIKLPVGNIAARPTGAAGMVRFNSELSRYEGYNGTAWVRLDGVEDADGNTKITAEATPGANDNTIRFYTNGTQVADLTSTRLNVINVDVDAININNNVISTTTTDTNLVLTPNGTGSVRTGNFSINGSTVTNTVNNSITYFNQTGDGYVKINSTGGFVIPTGLTTQRPPLFDIGMMRYNTDPGNFRVEIWDGGNWVNAGQAAGGGVTLAEAQDIGIVSAIIFG